MIRKRKWKSSRGDQPPSIFDLSKTPLQGASFFHLRVDCRGALNKLPCPFSDEYIPVSFGWNRQEVELVFAYPSSKFHVDPKNFREGDAIELFFDTRDNKELFHPSRFFHHFLFYPEKVEGVFGKEITRFRGDETHDLADSSDLEVSGSRSLKIVIPSHALFGYDPDQFKRLGFGYRIHFKDGSKQYLLTNKDFLEVVPATLASLYML
ncbi:hypothetical protein N9Y92_01215 [Chlamydiales bacterium]|nr:hypothetical protein [Chlamydiales bacterium]